MREKDVRKKKKLRTGAHIREKETNDRTGGGEKLALSGFLYHERL